MTVGVVAVRAADERDGAACACTACAPTPTARTAVTAMAASALTNTTEALHNRQYPSGRAPASATAVQPN